MRVLVTGGAGYLGCHVVRLLLEEGHEVRVFDRFCFNEEALADVADRAACQVVRGDVRRLQEHPGLFDGIDGIVHLAGLSSDPTCGLDEDMAEDVNVESTRELVDQALQHGVRRFVLASTCSVYGHGVFARLDEESPTNPLSPYGRTNLLAERAVLSKQNDHFEPVVARLATLFGWSSRMRFDLAVNQMVATGRAGSISVFGGGQQWRPFLHVRDAARALAVLLTAEAGKVGGETFNVGADGLNFRIADLARAVADHFDGVAIEVARDDDDLRSFHVVFDKLRERLGFECTHSLAEGVSEVRNAIEESGIDPSEDVYFNVRTMKRLLATPVDEGGEPIAPRLIALYRPTLGPEEERAVAETLRSGWLTSAARVPAFEKLFADTVGAPHAVAVTSCTAALHLSLHHAGVGAGDEVIMTPITWGSTANTVVHMGATPVFVDIQADTLNMDPDAVERAVTERTKAIVPVHLAGQPCDLDAIYDIAAKHGVTVVEDAAHALGASYKGVPIGARNGYTCFSFYAIKNITTIDGGAVTLWDPEEAGWLRVLAGNGMDQSAWDRYGRSSATAPVEVVTPGFKYRLTDVNAAIGIEQLKKFPSFKASRNRLAHLYRTVLAGIDEIALPRVLDEVEHAWHLMVVRLRLAQLTKTRDEIRDALRRENVGTGVHFYGLHLHKYYRERYGIRPEDLPNATAASEDMISLPLFPLMEDKHIQQVVDALKKVLAHARRRGT